MSTESTVPPTETAEDGTIGAPAAAVPNARGPGPAWRKSTYSKSPNQCVETARPHGTRMLVRDSTRPRAAVLALTGRAWPEFLGALRHGGFG